MLSGIRKARTRSGCRTIGGQCQDLRKSGIIETRARAAGAFTEKGRTEHLVFMDTCACNGCPANAYVLRPDGKGGYAGAARHTVMNGGDCKVVHRKGQVDRALCARFMAVGAERVVPCGASLTQDSRHRPLSLLCLTYRSAAGPPDTFHFTISLCAAPVCCSGWLSGPRSYLSFTLGYFDSDELWKVRRRAVFGDNLVLVEP